MNATFEFLAHTVGLARGLPVKSLLIEGTQGDTTVKFDEKAFVGAAIQHKVARSALAGLSMQGIALSEKNQSALKMSAHASALRAALTALDAVKITETLARHGIACAVIKGPAAALQLYGNLDTREFYDLDIVANIKEASEAIPILRELGFAPDGDVPCTPQKTARPHSRIAQRPHHLVFFHPQKPFRVELHDRIGWEAEAFGHDDFDAIFSRIVMLEATLGNKILRFPSLSRVDHTVLLVAHGANHAWCLLHWLLDVAIILACKDSTFQKDFAAKIAALDMGRHAKVAYALISRLYPIEISEPLARIIDADKKNLDGAIRYAQARLERGGRDQETFRNAVVLPVFYLAPQLKGVLKKWKVLLEPFKIPKVDLEAVPLPRPLTFLHFFMRPFFIIARRMAKK